MTCKNCNKETFTLICHKRVPVYYLFGYYHGDIQMSVWECDNCKDKIGVMPEQTFNEKDMREAKNERIKIMSTVQ